ncbi:hypothetical protein ACH3VS_12785 [Streptomyces sp. WSLK1-3]|uniref:hypothetical protein n=1 Tax=Streptomyces sp. WSLK1-3 TaxID=3375475 RepID=UPI0037BCD5E9
MSSILLRSVNHAPDSYAGPAARGDLGFCLTLLSCAQVRRVRRNELLARRDRGHRTTGRLTVRTAALR